MNQPLDHDPIEIENKKPYRLLSTLLELVPILFIILGLVLKNAALITLSMTTLAFVFIAAGWFIFRRNNYAPGSILFAVVTSIILASGILAVLFQILNWEGRAELKTATMPMLIVGVLANIIWYLFSKNKKQEAGFSLKMLLRLCVFAGLLLWY